MNSLIFDLFSQHHVDNLPFIHFEPLEHFFCFVILSNIYKTAIHRSQYFRGKNDVTVNNFVLIDRGTQLCVLDIHFLLTNILIPPLLNGHKTFLYHSFFLTLICFPNSPSVIYTNTRHHHSTQILKHFNFTPVFFFFYFLQQYCSSGIFPEGKFGLPPPGESQLRQSRATQPTVHAGCFCVYIIHRILTWTTGSLTCGQM